MAKTIDSLTALAATPNDTEDFFVVSDNGVTKKISAGNVKGDCIRNISGTITIPDAANFALNATTGTKIGTATTQKLAFYNATPVAQPAAVADATDAASTQARLNDLLSRLRTLGLIAT